MNGNMEHDPRNDAVTHAELCAAVLGELEGAELARVEAALATSPELRAERERIASTIALVRGSLAGPVALSGTARASLGRAAESPRSSAGSWRGALRAAAALLVVAGGLLFLRESTAPERTSGVRDELACAEPAPGARAAAAVAAVLPGSSAPVETSKDGRLAKLRDEHRATYEVSLDWGVGDASGLMRAGAGGAPAQSEVLLVERSKDLAYKGPGDSVPSGELNDSLGLGAAGGGRAGSERERAELVRRGRGEGVPVHSVSPPGGGGGPATPGPPQSMMVSVEVSADPAIVGRRSVRPEPPAGRETAGGEPGLLIQHDKEAPLAQDGRVAIEPLKGLGYIGDDDAASTRRRGVTGEDLRRLDRGRDPRAPHELSPAELDELVAERLERYLAECRRLPGERPRDMFFRYWGDNPFVLTQLDPLSTFGVDVDTASYALARRYLLQGHLPEKAQVRTEEFVNYFAPDVEAPRDATFAIHTDLAPSRFGNPGGERWMLRVVLRGKEVSREERRPLSLVFVVDVSGSMNQGNRLALVQHGLRLLAAQLDARDTLAVVAFSNEARVVLPPTSAARRAEIESALHTLSASGGTNTEAGLMLGYSLAEGLLDGERVTRVVLLSDGVANIGERDPKVLAERVRTQRQRGVYLNTIGVGMGNHNDVLLEQLANAGDGICNYVDDEREARRALVENFTGAMVPIARDVKVQLEFDPTRVRRFRQLGYENRAIAHQDFRNDAVDAGEVGAGHQVVALYELELATLDAEMPLGVVRLRWKEPTSGGRDPLEDDATEVERQLFASQATSWDGASAGYRRAVVVAQFAELLRRSTHAREVSLDEVLAEGAKLASRGGDPELAEFVSLMERSRELVLATRRSYDEFERCLDLYRFNCILRAEFEALGHSAHHARLVELERQNEELRRMLNELLRRRLAQAPR